MKRFFILLVICMVLSVIFAIGGQFLGSQIFLSWTHIKATPSLKILFTLYQHRTELNPHFVKPFWICSVISIIPPVIPFIMAIAVALSKPKRELHGSARFANLVEIRKLDC